MNNNKVLESVLNNCDIVDVISSFINTTKRGQNYFAICPFHEDTRPSLVISKQKKIFKCFVCQEGGNVITFVSKFKKIPFKNALIFLADKYNINYNKEDFKINHIDEKRENFFKMNKQACEIFKNFLNDKSNLDIKEYLHSRKIDDWLINEFEIGLSPKDNMLFKIMTNHENLFGENRDSELIWSKSMLLEYSLISLNDDNEYNDFFYNRLMIPIKDKYGNIIAFSGREIDSKKSVKYLNSKSSIFFKKSEVLFNIDKCLDNKTNTLYLFEGYFDVISAYKCGFNNSVATMGTSFNIEHVNVLKKNKISNVIICMDNDRAGKEACYHIGKILTENNINAYVVDEFINNYKDVNDLLVSTSSDDVIKSLKKYKTFIEFMIQYKFQEDILIDQKISIMTEISDFISKFANKNMISIYCELLASKTGFSFDDIKQNILSQKDFYERINSYKYNEFKKNNSVNLSDVKKIYKLEKTLLFNMIINNEIIELYYKYVNYLNIFNVNENYRYILNIINIIYKKMKYLDLNILTDQVNKIISDKNFIEKIKKEFYLYKSFLEKNNLKNFDIKKQSIDIILYLLNNRKRDIFKSNWNNTETINNICIKIDDDINVLKEYINENKTQ